MGKINIILLSSFMLVVFYSKQVIADPVILGVEGVAAHSKKITIKGSGFGEKANAAPLKFDDFESGSINKDLSGWVFSTSNGLNPVYSNEYQRGPGKKAAKARFPGNQYLSSFGIRDMNKNFDEIYIDFWYLYDPASPPSRNHKLWRFYTGSNSGQPDRYHQVFCDMNGSWIIETDGAGNDTWLGGWSIGDAVKKWNHMQGYFKVNTGSNSDGICKYIIDCTVYLNSTNYKFKNAGDPYWHSLWFGNYLGHDAVGGCPASPGESNTFWDYVYIDNTRARVEIGNKNNYNSCSHREIQIPSEWSKNQIKITFNAGSFSESDVVYLFVVDKDGNINSQGYPVTISSETLVLDTDAPNPPYNIRFK
jgi:hypothetical protein